MHEWPSVLFCCWWVFVLALALGRRNQGLHSRSDLAKSRLPDVTWFNAETMLCRHLMMMTLQAAESAARTVKHAARDVEHTAHHTQQSARTEL
jgi:hypothetical protein